MQAGKAFTGAEESGAKSSRTENLPVGQVAVARTLQTGSSHQLKPA